MSENILIAIAWPYANAEIHVGNITGSHLPGDIVARFGAGRLSPLHVAGGRERWVHGSLPLFLWRRVGVRRHHARCCGLGDIPAGCGTNLSGMLAENDGLLWHCHAEPGSSGG